MNSNDSYAETVRAKGRRQEYSRSIWNSDVPNPTAPSGAYVLEISEQYRRVEFLHGSERFRHVVHGTTTTSIMTKVGVDEYEFIKIALDGIIVRTWHAGCFPVFYRSVPEGVRLSNHPHLLFRSGETVTVKAQVVAQRISAQSLQVYNPFVTIGYLRDSMEYRLRRTGFARVRSCFVQDPEASYERLREALLHRFRLYVYGGRPIAVPLSGGYGAYRTDAEAAGRRCSGHRPGRGRAGQGAVLPTDGRSGPRHASSVFTESPSPPSRSLAPWSRKV